MAMVLISEMCDLMNPYPQWGNKAAHVRNVDRVTDGNAAFLENGEDSEENVF